MAAIRIGCSLWAVLLLIGCGGKMSISTEFDPEDQADLQAYRTYGWLPHPMANDGSIDTAFVAAQVTQAADEVLQGRGYRRVSGDEPDFLIGYFAAVQSKVDVRTVNAYDGYRSGYDGPVGSGYNVDYTDEYEQGSLILDIVDRGSDLIVWRGTAQAKVNPGDDESKRSKRIREAVKKILAEFPPKPE